MKLRFLLVSGALLSLGGAFYIYNLGSSRRSPQGQAPAMSSNFSSGRNSAAQSAPARAAASAATNPAPAEPNPQANPYAAALREPGKTKRAWDPAFLTQFNHASSGDPIRFELTAGVIASGIIKITQSHDGAVTYLSGELTEPQPGKFFFLTPPTGGKAGKAVGVIEFPATKTAYRIEPTGPNGEPELWQRRLDEVVCQTMPLMDESSAAKLAAQAPPLRPDTVPAFIPSYNSNIVSLQSFPGSPAVLLLDFFGGYTPTWGDVTYPRPDVSNAQIRDLWKRVAEDYMPFNINVTTDIRVYQNAPINSRQKCVFSPSISAMPAGAAGVAYIGSWNWGSDTVCWSIYTSGKAGGEVGAHEPGHTLGLGHQGTSTAGYYGGQGSGATGWGPIMGVGYYQPVSSWAKGEYLDANNHEDELNIIITQNNNVSYRPDDTGSTLATARFLEVYPNSTASAEGVIERTGDTDAFQFTTSGGALSLTANAVGDWADLAVMATLANSADTVIASNNPQTVLSATITTNLPAGIYTFRVTGAGRNSPLTNGFSSYASLGYYSVTGSVAGARLPTRLSVAEHATNGTLVGTVPANNVFASPLAFAITSGNTGNTFSIDSSGTVRVANNTLLDYYRLATNTMLPVRFELLINITNQANPVLTELNRRVVIAVLDVNDPPVVAGFTNSVLEHGQIGLALGTVTVGDPDFSESLSFSFVSGNANGAFAIDQSGLVTVAGDLNAAVQNAYTLAVAVSDNAVVNPLVSTGYVVINVVTNLTPFRPGSISYALYDGIGTGNLVTDLTGNPRFPSDPSSEKQMLTFEGHSNRADGYGAVMRGYLLPPVGGNYTFYIATDDNGELWMSTTTNAASMTRIAYISGSGNWASPRQWNKFSTQQSAVRALVAGQGYYIEARMKEGSGGDNLAVAWKGPVTANQTNVIPGQYLAPAFLSYLPHATGFTAAVRRDAVAGTRLGRVTVQDVNTADTDAFAILSGNTDGIFSIDNSGWVRVASETALQATATPTYTITVRTTDSGSPALAATATVTLNITETNVLVPTALQRELFYNIGTGTAVSDLTSNSKYPGRPDALAALSSFASPADIADGYGSRIRGLLTPTTSGAYTFFISSDDNSQLLLSTDNTAAHATVIASVPNWTAVNTWTTYAQQKSAVMNLTAGVPYYIEALQKEGGGSDHVEVGWAGPGIVDTNGLPSTNVIATSFLSPVDINSAPQFANQTLQVFNTVADNTFIGNVVAADSPLDTLTFKILSGNTNNMFAITPDTGGITVTDSSLIATGALTSFALTILVQDSGFGGLYPVRTTQATVTINVVSTNSGPFVWTGAAGTNNWASSGNWGGVVPGANSRVVFGYPSQQANVNDVATALASVQFTSSGFSLSGGPLTLQSGLTNSSGDNVWGLNTTLGAAQTWFNSGGTLTLSGAVTNAGRLLTLIANSDIQLNGPVSGTAGLTKSGTARLLMQGVHSYAGVTTVSAASGSTAALQLAGPNDLDLRSSDVTMNGRMDLGHFDAIIGGLYGSGTIYANDIPQPVLTVCANNHPGSFTGVIQDSTAGLGITLAVVKAGSSSLTLSGNNTFTGGFTVNSGFVTLSGANSSSPAGRGVLTIKTGAIVNATTDNQLGNEANGYLTSLNIAGGLFNAWNNNHVNSITFNGGMLQITSGASQVDGMDLRAISSVNPMVTSLASASTAYLGSKMTLNAPAVFNIEDGPPASDLFITGTIVGANSLTKAGAGTLVLASDCTYSGGTVISTGVLQLGTGGSAGSVTGNLTNNASLVYVRSGILTQSGVISGTGSLTKSGGGTVTLGAANTYSGPTTISQGTLSLGAAGSINNSPTIAVQAGANFNVASVLGGFTLPIGGSLTGNGTVTGNSRINGTLAPGPGIGGLTFNGTLTLAGTNLMEINKTGGTLTNDWLAISGTLTYGGVLVVTNSGSPLAAGDIFPLFTSPTFGNAFASIVLPPLGYGLHWDTTQLAVNGTIHVATPTPPQILPVTLLGTNLQLTIQSELGVTYVLQSAPGLISPITWMPVSTNLGTGYVITIPAPLDPTQPQQYFRFLAY